jgi:hypothetical protein
VNGHVEEEQGFVFVLSKPSEMLEKLRWEIDGFIHTVSGQMGKPEAYNRAGYQAFNCAVTAWHLADWTWAYADPALKIDLAKRFSFKLKQKDRNNRNEFLCSVADKSRDLHICRYIANSSKHLKLDNEDERGFHLKVGKAKFSDDDVRFGLLVIDKGNTILIERIFGRAFAFWGTLFGEIGYLAAPELPAQLRLG